ncbi:MAG: type II secretion system protein GspN [Sandaracinaceae bacterium]|nr:type II secretion system protein GspN [Sandaracinaceae bacterium]
MSTATAPSAFSSFLARFRRAPSPSPAKPAGGGRRWLRVVGYVFYFLFAFVTFTYLTFPYDRVRDFVVHQIELAVPGSEVEIVSLEPAWVTGIEAHGVRIRLPAEPAEPPRPGAAPSTEPRRPVRPSVTVPYLYARVGILSYLLGTTEVTFEAELDGGGTIEGVLADRGTATHVTAHIHAVDLRRIGVLRHYVGFSLGGEVTGDIDLEVADEADATDGTIHLSIAQATVGDEQFTVPLPIPGMTGIQLTRIDVGALELQITVEDGVGRIEQLSGDGSDIVLRGTGTVRVNRVVRMSALDLLLRAAIQPAYLERNPVVRGAIELAGTNPLVAPYRAPDGAFQVRLQGTLGARVTALAAGSATIPQ